MSKEKREPNYRALFVIGLAFIGTGTSLYVVGLIASGISIFAVGIVFLIVSIMNRKKWTDPYRHKNTNALENKSE